MAALPQKKAMIVLGFLALQTMIIVRNIAFDYPFYYWYCDVVPLIFAVFFLTNNLQGVKGVARIGAIGQILYIISFFSLLLFQKPLFGFEAEVHDNLFYILTTLVMHLSAPVALALTYKVAPQKASLLYSLVMLWFIYVTTLIGTDPVLIGDENYNYVYYAAPFEGFPYYTQLWMYIIFTGVVLPTYLLELLFCKYLQKGCEPT